MTGEWQTTTIGQQVTLQRGIDITKAQQRPGAVPVVSSGGISSYHDTAYAKGPGVVLGRKGTLGTVFYVTEDYWPHDTSLWVRDFHGNYPRFVYYFFKSIASYLASLDVGTSNPALNRNHVHPIAVQWPEVDEQKTIARILGSLDDKIALNRRMNRTLEALAAAIFKSWFVDFDPVVARAEGRQPFGMDAETAALFPAAFEQTEVGVVPVGWRVVPIGELVKVVGGTTPSTGNSVYWEGGTIAWATPKDLAGLADPLLLDTERHVTQAGLRQISSGLLPAGTVLMSSRAPVGYLAIAEIRVAVNQGFIALICDQGLPNYYVIHWLRQNMESIVNRANGTTFLEISKANFRPIPAVVPPEPILQRFTAIAGKLHGMMVANARESLMLAAIRDALLPKLLAGEIRVGVIP